jgi:hypothetical protein
MPFVAVPHLGGVLPSGSVRGLVSDSAEADDGDVRLVQFDNRMEPAAGVVLVAVARGGRTKRD